MRQGKPPEWQLWIEVGVLVCGAIGGGTLLLLIVTHLLGLWI